MNTRTLVSIKAIPKELRDYNQWIIWRYEFVGGKRTKVPYNPAARTKASVMNPATWTDLKTAVVVYKDFSEFNGIGFVMTGKEGIIGIDIDGNIDSSLIDRFNSYSELTPSKNGCRIFIKVATNLPSMRFDKVEIYNDKRFFTVTGDKLSQSDSIEERRDEFLKYYNELLIDRNPLVTEEDIEDKSHIAANIDNQTLLDRIFNRDKYGELNRMRYEGNIPECDYHMTKKGWEPDDSKARYYLIRCFWNWTQDIDRVLELMEGSALYDEKWESGRNGQRFIEYEIERIVRKK